MVKKISEVLLMNRKTRKLIGPALYIMAGMVVGLIIHRTIGCSSGACPITASPINSVLYFGFAGLLFSMIMNSDSDKNHKIEEKKGIEHINSTEHKSIKGGETVGKIKLFYLKGCPYCKKAEKAIEELISENPEYGKVEIERLEENQNAAEIAKYNYYYVPTMYIGEEKAYEASPIQNYDSIKASVKAVLDKALEAQV